MRIPTILGTEYFRDQSRCHIRFWGSRKPLEIILGSFYTKINKNSRRRCADPPSLAPRISGIEAAVIFLFGDLENSQI